VVNLELVYVHAQLTLTWTRRSAAQAKRYRRSPCTSVSQDVERYLGLVGGQHFWEDESPVLRMLRGAAGCPDDTASSARKYREATGCVDLNIVLDVVLDRAEAASRARWGALERGKAGGTPGSWSHYHFLLVSRAQGSLRSTRDREFCRPLRGVGDGRFCVEPFPWLVRLRGRRLRIRGGSCGCDAIVTRDPRIRRIASSNRRLPSRTRLADRV